MWRIGLMGYNSNHSNVQRVLEGLKRALKQEENRRAKLWSIIMIWTELSLLCCWNILLCNCYSIVSLGHFPVKQTISLRLIHPRPVPAAPARERAQWGWLWELAYLSYIYPRSNAVSQILISVATNYFPSNHSSQWACTDIIVSLSTTDSCSYICSNRKEAGAFNFRDSFYCYCARALKITSCA